MPQPWHALVFAASAPVLLVLGVIFLTRPKRVQEWALKGSDQGLSRSFLFKDYVASPQYVWQVRFAGVLTLGMGLLAAYATIKAIR